MCSFFGCFVFHFFRFSRASFFSFSASKQTMRSPPGAAASSPSARKSSSSSSSSSTSLRSPDMLQGLARGGLARRGSGAVAQALASPSPARPTKQIAGSAAARTTAAAPLARIGMQNDSPLPFFSIGGERKIGNGGNGWNRSPELSCKRKKQKLTVLSLSLSLSLSVSSASLLPLFRQKLRQPPWPRSSPAPCASSTPSSPQ